MKNTEFYQVGPCIIEFNDVIQDTQTIIDIAMEQEDWQRATVSIDRDHNEKVRKNNILPIIPTYDKPSQWFYLNQVVWLYAGIYAQLFKTSFSHMEHLQLLHYTTDNDFYLPHADDGPGMNRIFSSLLYLNDVEEGGDTYFTNFDISIKPKSGKLVFFPANFTYIHEARPPISGDKFVLVTWFDK
jgi:hypothetical protein